MNKPENDGFAVTLDAPGYYSLAEVLGRAFDQASNGKGKERHANALPFSEQPMQTIAGQVGVGFLLGQALKKAQESQVLPHDRAVAELLGAINYLAGAVMFMERAKAATPVDVERPLCREFLTGTGSQPKGIGMPYTAKKHAAMQCGTCLAPNVDAYCSLCVRDGVCKAVANG